MRKAAVERIEGLMLYQASAEGTDGVGSRRTPRECGGILGQVGMGLAGRERIGGMDPCRARESNIMGPVC